MKIRHRNNLNASRRGTALIAAVAFMLLVAAFGAGFLAISLQHQFDTVSKAQETRLTVAAEAAIESKRGRFKLVPGTPGQHDWNFLPSDGSWWDVDGPVTINDITVQVQARRDGANFNSVPRATLRGVAGYVGGKQRAVEFDIKVASFTESSVWQGGTSTYNPGVNYKTVGNHYNNGDMFINSAYTGVEFFNETNITGVVTSYGAEGALFNFKRQDKFVQNAEVQSIPPTAYPWDQLRARSIANSRYYKENTLEIRFNADGTMTRWYVARTNTAAANNTTLNGSRNTWVDTTNGNRIDTNINNTHYEVRSQTISIPDECVIMVEAGEAALTDCDSIIGGIENRYIQLNHSYTAGSHQNTSTEPDHSSRYLAGWNTTDYGTVGRKILLVHGTLGLGRRVTLVAAGGIMPVIKRNIAYRTLVDNPSLRAQPNKESSAALGFTEMLGVISDTDINFGYRWWSPLSAAQECPQLGTGWGATTNNQYCIDGCYFAVNVSGPGSWINETRELWLCGGNIGGRMVNAGFGNIFQGARHYDWDWRLNETTPPYFLNAYNATARFIDGTWRSYDITP